MTLLLAITALSAAAAPTASDTGSPLQVTSRMFVEQRSTDADGAVRADLMPATRATPGDPILVVLEYRNAGARPLDGIVFNNPVPAAVAYRGAAEAAAPELSVDGATFGNLADLTVSTATGELRAAAAGDIRHVRWRLAAPLAPGATGRLAFRAVLN